MKILIIGPSWVGDMVMAQTLFLCLQNRHPDCAIDVLAPQWTREILSRMPEVRQALPFPVGHGELALGKRRAVGKSLRSEHYDQAIVLPNSFKSALVPFFAGIGRRTGWRGEARGWLLNDCRRLDKARYPLMVQRFAALAWPAGAELPEELPAPVLRADPAQAAALRGRYGLESPRPVVAFCPGAEYGPAKQWPARHFASLAGSLIRQGFAVWLLGSARDKPHAEEIRDALELDPQAHCRNLCGLTTLGEAVDLLAEAACVVTNDSGLMHIAAALSRPLVVLYGSSTAAFTPPLTDKKRLLSLDLPCSPCFKRECPLLHLDCLNKLTPDRVLTAMHELNIRGSS